MPKKNVVQRLGQQTEMEWHKKPFHQLQNGKDNFSTVQ